MAFPRIPPEAWRARGAPGCAVVTVSCSRSLKLRVELIRLTVVFDASGRGRSYLQWDGGRAWVSITRGHRPIRVMLDFILEPLQVDSGPRYD